MRLLRRCSISRPEGELARGMTPVEFAMRFTLSHADVDIALTGTVNPDHLETNIKSMEAGDLPAELLHKGRNIFD